MHIQRGYVYRNIILTSYPGLPLTDFIYFPTAASGCGRHGYQVTFFPYQISKLHKALHPILLLEGRRGRGRGKEELGMRKLLQSSTLLNDYNIQDGLTHTYTHTYTHTHMIIHTHMHTYTHTHIHTHTHTYIQEYLDDWLILNLQYSNYQWQLLKNTL